MIAPEQCAILTTSLTGYHLMSAFRCLLSFMTPMLIRLKVLVSCYLTQMYNNHLLKHRFLYKEAFMQVHRAQHCIALRIIANHITGTQTLNSLQSPALWCIFEAVLGILYSKHQFAREHQSIVVTTQQTFIRTATNKSATVQQMSYFTYPIVIVSNDPVTQSAVRELY